MSGPGDQHILEKNGDAIQVRHGEYPGESIGVRVFVWRTDDKTLRVTLMGITESCAYDVTEDRIKKVRES